MPDGLPDRSQYARDHEEIEEVLKNQRNTLQVVSVDIQASESTDGTTGRYDDHPVPLPSPSDRSESLLAR